MEDKTIRKLSSQDLDPSSQDMEEEPGDWVAHQAEVDTLINKIQVNMVIWSFGHLVNVVNLSSDYLVIW